MQLIYCGLSLLLSPQEPLQETLAADQHVRLRPAEDERQETKEEEADGDCGSVCWHRPYLCKRGLCLLLLAPSTDTVPVRTPTTLLPCIMCAAETKTGILARFSWHSTHIGASFMSTRWPLGLVGMRRGSRCSTPAIGQGKARCW